MEDDKSTGRCTFQFSWKMFVTSTKFKTMFTQNYSNIERRVSNRAKYYQPI